MLIAMEGSSPTILGENNYKYYVWDAYKQTKESSKLYIPGPATISWSLSEINIRTMADNATTFIRGGSGPIYLVGWSRGAAACVQVALDLKRSSFEQDIEAMFLYDPVDQDGSTADFLNTVPSNVKNCYHAEALKKDGIWASVFPTCAKKFEPGVNYISGKFNTTHGGIAGCDGGSKGDAGSGSWMRGCMVTHGVV
ncbi:MAG TPA: hypothetical protein PKM58_05985 [Pyrinomonadaceae bacterium]|nr:hypothetical protein [Pyrinomonadaceae bacterium]HNU06424.1 hypothetical protein [Pyrinomonadaceae bacterium]